MSVAVEQPMARVVMIAITIVVVINRSRFLHTTFNDNPVNTNMHMNGEHSDNQGILVVHTQTLVPKATAPRMEGANQITTWRLNGTLTVRPRRNGKMTSTNMERYVVLQ